VAAEPKTVALTSGATGPPSSSEMSGHLVGRGAADLPDRLEDQPDPVDETLGEVPAGRVDRQRA
jgi:hypothetical protein